MNLNIPPKIVLPAVLFVAGTVVGLGLGWKLYRPSAPKVEPYAPEIRQKDGSLVLERKPMPLTEARKAVPVPVLPKGATVERLEKIVIQPKPQPLPGIPIPGSGSSPAVLANTCPPVTVALALLKMKDGSHRVVASSPDGTILSGVDIPVTPERPEAKPLKWAAGALWNPSDRTYGAYLRRAMGPFEVGAQVEQVRLPVFAGGGTKTEGKLSVGIKF